MDIVLPVTEARNRFTKLVDDVSKTFAKITITRKGKPEAVLISSEEYEALIDSLEILSNKNSMDSIKRAKTDIRAGRIKPLSDVIKNLKINV
jgi:prevent-host-death family protein